MPGISISMPSELNNELDRLVYDLRKSRSEIIREALEKYIKEHSRESVQQGA